MRAFFLFRTAKAFKYEILIIGSFLILLTTLPLGIVIALAGGNSFSSTSDGIYTGPGDPADTYAFGNCTWWVYLQRKAINETIPTTWGNANTWATRAQADGYQVDKTPSAGAIMQTDFGKLGHVAFVTAVDPSTGAWTISEMNVIGFDVVDTETLQATQALAYNFIHQPINTVSVPGI
jgi:surface antigen